MCNKHLLSAAPDMGSAPRAHLTMGVLRRRLTICHLATLAHCYTS